MKLKALTLCLVLPIAAVAQNAIGTAVAKFVESSDAKKCIVNETHENNHTKKLAAYMDIMDYRFDKSQAKKAMKLVQAVRDHRFDAYQYKELIPGFDDSQMPKIWIDRGGDNDDKDMMTVGTDNEASYAIAYVRSKEDEKYRHAYILSWKIDGATDNYMTMRIISIFGRDPQKLVHTPADFVAEFGKLLSVLGEADTQRNATSFARSALNRIYEFCDTYNKTIRLLSRDERSICCESLKAACNKVQAVKNDSYNTRMAGTIDYYIWNGRKR